ncbi:DUF4192 family protein [Knoellia subterranea]|uniref:DUF4192 domain-containing protein n=1 Tax=Knoellia subterranea KCTC 19937 TaxID=1385521 RepID=A0A0A0JGN3_9MICO|nr:DUF4192 family protein [Knoellia subterranea]KGN36308.1 hypothetical protein N803_05760 [Knoellia subterranea KCTC 19937]
MTSLKISTTEEWLAVLPHQVGHHLAQCVAVMTVTSRALGPVARVDLPPEKYVRQMADGLLDGLLRVKPQAAMLVGYEDVPGESRSMLHAVHHGLQAAGVGIIDHVVVRDGRWWGWCCRPVDELDGLRPDHVDGHALVDDSCVPAAAAFIANGSAPLASRDAVGALVEEDPGLSAGVAEALSAISGSDPVPELWGRLLAPVGERGDAFQVTDQELARMLCSLATKPWRDALVAWMSPVMFPIEKVDEVSRRALDQAVPAGPAGSSDASKIVLRRLLGLARRVPDAFPQEAAAISTLAGCVAWGVGNGSTAADAVTRALRVVPEYLLATFLERMVAYQLRPRHTWPDVAA